MTLIPFKSAISNYSNQEIMCLVWFLSSGRIQDSTEHCLLGQSINAFSVHGFAYCVMTQYLLNWCPQWSKMCWIFSPFRFFFLMKWVKITDTIQVFFFLFFLNNSQLNIPATSYYAWLSSSFLEITYFRRWYFT